MTSVTPLSSPISYRTIKYPHAGTRKKEFLETLCWKNGSLPPLDKPGWHQTKMMIQETGGLHRMSITKLKVVRNAFNTLVRVEFDYIVETYDDKEKIWL
jgi:hypothetical protein